MNRVVYLIDQPLDERNYERFGVQAWIDKGWNAEVWDLTPWANSRMWRDFSEYGREPRSFGGYYTIGSVRDLARRLRTSAPIRYFIDLTSESYHSLRAKLALVHHGAQRVICTLGALPAPPRTHNGSLLGSIQRAIELGPRGALGAVRDRIYARTAAALAAPSVVVVAGSTSAQLATAGCTIIQAHNFDYDIYLKVARAAPSDGGYAVFIDQDYCFHPEFTCKESSTVITPARYFPTLCNGLRKIGAALGLPMRIAAHPRATYRQRNVNYLEDFALEYGRTGELIRDCDLVVCHDSTAIQFAVLFAKPLIFVTTAELIHCYEGRSIVAVAAELGKSPINLDEDLGAVDWRGQLHVDTARYARYRSRYIKSEGSPEAPAWEIVIDQIERAGARKLLGERA